MAGRRMRSTTIRNRSGTRNGATRNLRILTLSPSTLEKRRTFPGSNINRGSEMRREKSKDTGSMSVKNRLKGSIEMFTRKCSYLIALFLLVLPHSLSGQSKIENLIIVTCDGLRWQDVFTGMDSAIANN